MRTDWLCDTPYYAHAYSPLARMLPQLEQAPLFDAINFELIPTSGDGLDSNQTVMKMGFSLYVCPSDGVHAVNGYGRANYRYRFNIGATPWYAPGYDAPSTWSGPFTAGRFYSPADFTDGLTQTVGVSERLQGDWTRGLFSRGDYLYGEGYTRPLGGADWASHACSTVSPGLVPEESRSGKSWFLSGLHFTNYNHCATPNSRIPDCSTYPHVEDIHNRTMHSGVFTARSNHHGGVNVLMMDGSVHFPSDSINMSIWRALATRDGGEAISTPDF